MMKKLMAILFALILASASWSQDSEESDVPEAEVTEASEPGDANEEEDDSDLDDQGYGEEEEEDFIPSQEVSADQSLRFPVDI